MLSMSLTFSLRLNSLTTPAYRDENKKGSTVTARTCLIGANLIDAGGL
jgi:hypothetical protein